MVFDHNLLDWLFSWWHLRGTSINKDDEMGRHWRQLEASQQFLGDPFVDWIVLSKWSEHQCWHSDSKWWRGFWFRIESLLLMVWHRGVRSQQFPPLWLAVIVLMVSKCCTVIEVLFVRHCTSCNPFCDIQRVVSFPNSASKQSPKVVLVHLHLQRVLSIYALFAFLTPMDNIASSLLGTLIVLFVPLDKIQLCWTYVRFESWKKLLFAPHGVLFCTLSEIWTRSGCICCWEGTWSFLGKIWHLCHALHSSCQFGQFQVAARRCASAWRWLWRCFGALGL